jgi:serine/threonine-protein kinase
MRTQKTDHTITGTPVNPSIVAGTDEDFFNRYQLVANIGAGSMGDVFWGIQHGAVGFQRLIVVKRIPLHVWSGGYALNMFLMEASAIAQLKHPNINRLVDVCKTETSIYLVLEYVDGETLQFIHSFCAQNRSSIPLPIVCNLIVGACDAAAYAFDGAISVGVSTISVLHRNIGLQNLMIDRNGYLKVLDFNIVQTTMQSDPQLSGPFQSNLEYAAPEIFTEAEVDHRADIYSLGLCLYELLTLNRAFRFEKSMTLPELIKAITTQNLQPPSKIRAKIWPELDSIVQKATSKEPNSRYQHASEMASKLRSVSEKHRAEADEYDVKKWFKETFQDRIENRTAREKKISQKASLDDPASEGLNLIQQYSSIPPGFVLDAVPEMAKTASKQKEAGKEQEKREEREELGPETGAQTEIEPPIHISAPRKARRVYLFVLAIALLVFLGAAIAVKTLDKLQKQGGAPSGSEETSVVPTENLFVFSTPGGAEIYVDGEYRGNTGDEGLFLEVPPNQKHKIELKKSGFLSHYSFFVAPNTGAYNLNVQLEKSPDDMVEARPETAVSPSPDEPEVTPPCIGKGCSKAKRKVKAKRHQRSRKQSDAEEEIEETEEIESTAESETENSVPMLDDKPAVPLLYEKPKQKRKSGVPLL